MPELEKMKNRFYSELEDHFKTNEELADIADCLVEQLKALNASEIIVKQATFSESRRKVSRRHRKKLMRALNDDLNKMMNTAVVFCSSYESFGKVFDDYFEKNENETESEDETAEQAYCIRQYMIENNIIDTNVYKVNPNPLNSSITDINCGPINKAYIKEVEDELKIEVQEDFDRLSRRASRCIMRTIQAHKYFEFILKVKILGDIKISDELKSEEKKTFIEKMKKMFDEIVRC